PPVPPLPPGFVRSPSQERPLIPPPPPPPPLPLQSLPRLHTPLASPVPQRSYSSTPGDPNGDKRYDVTAPAVFRPLLIPFAPINPLPSLGDPPVLTVSLPTQPSLSSAAQSVKTINNPSRQVSWSKQVLDLVERIQISERRLYNDNLAPNLDPRLEVLVDQAIQHILSLSQIPGKPLYPYAAEAIYLRGTLAASGSFPAYIKRDLRAAFKDFETAARNSFDPAWFRIGRDYEGVNQIEKARECYERGVKIEEKNCLYVGIAQLLGQLGLSINQRAAIPLLKHAADWSDVDTPQPAYVFGMLLLGEYSHLELPASTFAPYLPNSHAEPRMIEARRYIEHAAYLNFAPAQCKAGWAYEYSKMGCPYDPLLSVQYYSLASQQGEEEADMALSKWFLCGAEGCFDKDEHLAFTFAEKAARRGFPIAEFAMGYYHEVGVGCNIDVAVARKWYTRASKRGNTDASERLRALNERNPSVLSREEHDSLAQNTLIRKRTLAREASKAAG
ncbi:uncharacterized protein EI90DRAFT_2899171, partial [Cantharellus anzutake]|uniref:uncharacterized protein n=1 Tax=Cantharellus anzutake TaxID=1750568 RepID=UPI001905B4AC